MDLQQAEAFVAVAEELHFGRAAERLRMAQPPLSRIIKKLERSLGAELFVRSTRSVEITSAGTALLGPAREMIAASLRAKQAVQAALDGETGEVKIGFAGASTNFDIGELSQQLRQRHPKLTLDFHSAQFSHLGLERVLDGTLDVAIGRWDFLPPEIDSHLLAIESLLIALPQDHALAGADAIDMADLAEESWIVLPGGYSSALHNRTNSLTLQAGFVPKVVQTAPDSWTQMVLVSTGMGCALSLDSIRANIFVSGVSYVPVRAEDTTLEVRLIWRRGHTNPALANMISLTKEVFGEPRRDLP